MTTVLLLGLLVTTTAWHPSAASPTGGLPPAGTDDFDSSVEFTLVLFAIAGSPFNITASGPTIIERSDPSTLPDGRQQIDTEIVSLHLTGIIPFLGSPLTVRESSVRDSTGRITEQAAGTGFPADSFFDVFVEIDLLGTTLYNRDPVGLSAVIDAIPPFQKTYTPPAILGVALYDATGRQVGLLAHAAHFVGQKPSFSIAPGGPSGLDPATIFDLPTAPGFLPPGLGLQSGDDVDGLSYGLDYINYNADVRFSVDPNADGSPGSQVAAEAAKMPNEAHGDEFAISPSLPFGGSNTQILDETGDTAPPFPLLISDDVDALAEHPTTLSDLDGDGTPDMAIYFSLASGSPSLGTIPASPADILMASSLLPSSPTVFIPEADLGLIPGDDLDAICLEVTPGSGPTVLFSLAPGSPTLAATGGSPADLYGGTTVPLPSPPPLYIPASLLGLLDTDNLNALKCTWPEVDFFRHSVAEIVVQFGVISETIRLSGPAEVRVPISGDGAVPNRLGPDQVQTELVQMELVGFSRGFGGPVKVRIQPVDFTHDPPIFHSEGAIIEQADVNPGVLDLPPFTPKGLADSFFDVFVEVEMGGQMHHTHNPKLIQAVISHKPPAEEETYKGVVPVQLYDASENPTGVFITQVSHTPRPFLDLFDTPAIVATLTISNGAVVEAVNMSGWMNTLLFTNEEGLAQDRDGDGLDQVQTEILALNLTGTSEMLGNLSLGLRDTGSAPMRLSVGEVEETNNIILDHLDVWPYGLNAAGRSASSWFIELLSGQSSGSSGSTIPAGPSPLLYNQDPLTMTATITSIPLGEGESLLNQNNVELLDQNGQPSGFTIVGLNIALAPQGALFLPLISGGAGSQATAPFPTQPSIQEVSLVPGDRWRPAPAVLILAGVFLAGAGVLGWRNRP